MFEVHITIFFRILHNKDLITKRIFVLTTYIMCHKVCSLLTLSMKFSVKKIELHKSITNCSH